jgi:hypothetical protein
LTSIKYIIAAEETPGSGLIRRDTILGKTGKALTRTPRHALPFVLLLLVSCGRNTPVARLPAPPNPPQAIIAVAVGDISCDPENPAYNRGFGTAKKCHMLGTSNLAASLKPRAVLLLGDNQYENGNLDAYKQSYAKSWGRKELKDISHPNSGGNEACKPIGCEPGSEQEMWLRKDLASNTSSCTLAFWHRPHFTSGLRRDSIAVRPLWQDLYASNADIVLNGHVHHYERFSPQKPDGSADPKHGITQFTVGTGGRDLKGFFPVQENSQTRLSKFFGVLKLELGESSFVWEFISESGQVLDSGSGECHAKHHAP